MSEPVTVETARARLGLASNFRDPEIAGLLAAAVAHVEDLTGWTIKARNVVETFECLPVGGGLEVMTRPATALVSLVYFDTDGEAQTVTGARLAGPVHRRWLFPAIGEAWPTDVAGGIAATFEAGYAGTAADPVPDKLVQAILLLVGAWFDDPQGQRPEPPQVATLCAGFRRRYV